MKVGISLFNYTFEEVDQILTNGKRVLHWIEGGAVGLVSHFMNPNYFFFKFLNGERMVGIGWIYDLDIEPLVGVLVWERIENFRELLEIVKKLFKIEIFKVAIDKPNNLLAKRLIDKLDLKEVNYGWEK